MKKKILALLAISSVAQSDQLDNLIDTSSAIVDQIDRGIAYVGSASEYSYLGTSLSDGSVSESAHITSQQIQAYNDALSNMASYMPYGDVLAVLNEQANTELELMDQAVDVFTEAVVEMVQVVQVAEMAEEASTPDEEAQVQEFVVNNQEVLTITQEEVTEYNQSIDDIETHANNASAFIAVAANVDAVDFLQQGAENNNTTAEQATLSYSANNQWVKMQWAGTNNATAVFLNGNDNFGLDLYVSDADILVAGQESNFYLTGPTAQGYDCFMYGDCDYEP
jgi:hypothetical protein